jgi:hypothetical protein
VRLRSEVDVHGMQRQIDLKANEEAVKSDFSNHEFKISTLDRNIIRIAADFETFQHAFNKLHSAILELQEANRDVLLGKRTTNCLSCGKGSEGNHQIFGKDGRVYKGTPAEAMRPDTAEAQPYLVYDGHSPLNGTQPYAQHLMHANSSEIYLQN